MVTVNRQGKTLVIPVTLKSRDGKNTVVKSAEKADAANIGFELENVDAKTLKRLELPNGVKVKSISNGKIKRFTEMREGFIITHVDNVAVKSAEQINEILKKKKAGELITFAGVYEDFPREYIYALRM
jgi:S1-C subfamily serine protease